MIRVPVEVMWVVSAILVEAAIIDGLKYRVPNWLTAHFAIGGLVFAYWTGGLPALAWSAQGLLLGLGLLLPVNIIGAMGAGDVKLLAAVGAWVGASTIFGAFATTAIVGGFLGVGIIFWSGEGLRHLQATQVVVQEVLTIRDPGELARRAAERKPTSKRLPYAIPIAVGSIGYFTWMGMLGKM